MISGDNRADSSLKSYFNSIQGTSQYWWGVDNKRQLANFSDSAGYRNAILSSGAVVCIMYLLFFVLYAEIDQFDATKYTLDKDKLTVMDKWLLSKLNTVVKGVDENLADYKLLEAARLLQDFVDELSNWYVRRSRERFWVQDMTDDKITAYMTLYTALVTISKAAAPMIPFMTEEIYRNLVCSIDKNAPESIHLTDFPEVHEDLIDKALEEDMEEVLQVVTLGRAARNAANIKNRQPVANIYVKAGHKVGELYQNIIKEELNIKEIHFVEDTSQFTSYTFKPQLKVLGQKYGKKSK